MNGVWQRWPFLSRSPKAAAVTLDRVLQWPLFLSVGAICPWELGHSIHLECAVRPQLKPWMWTSGSATQAGRCFLFLFCVQLQLPTYGSGTGDICTDEEKCFFFFWLCFAWFLRWGQKLDTSLLLHSGLHCGQHFFRSYPRSCPAVEWFQELLCQFFIMSSRIEHSTLGNTKHLVPAFPRRFKKQTSTHHRVFFYLEGFLFPKNGFFFFLLINTLGLVPDVTTVCAALL